MKWTKKGYTTTIWAQLILIDSIFFKILIFLVSKISQLLSSFPKIPSLVILYLWQNPVYQCSATALDRRVVNALRMFSIFSFYSHCCIQTIIFKRFLSTGKGNVAKNSQEKSSLSTSMDGGTQSTTVMRIPPTRSQYVDKITKIILHLHETRQYF